VNVRTYPYRTPSPDRIIAERWSRLDDDGVVDFTGPVEGWDYVTDLRLVRRISLDLSGIRADSGLPPETPLKLSVRSRPSTSLIRTLVTSVPLDHGETQSLSVEVVVRGQDLSGSVTVETMIELAATRPHAAPFTPNRAGSILWIDEASAPLEGDSGLLPVAPVPFSTVGLPPSAAWYVSLATGRWDWTAMGSLLVLLNTENPAVVAALPDPARDNPAPDTAHVFDTLEVDFLTDLVGRALDDDEFIDQYVVTGDEEPPEDDYSLGSLVRALVRTRLTKARETVDEALVRLRDVRAQDPSMFRATVQDGLGYPRSVNR
jgi:hypothetical protein